MNKKKIVALVATATMVLSAMPVGATQVTTATGTSTVTSDAVVDSYDNSPIYKVTLPTSNSLGFTVDPYGLVNLASGSSIDVSKLANTGAIVSATSAAAIMKNESSVPVKVTAKFYVTDTNPATGATGTAVQLKNTHAATATGTANNMLLAVIPSSTRTATVASYAASTTVVPVTSTTSGSTTDIDFKLNKAEYQVQSTGTGFQLVQKSGADNFDATAFKIGGEVNPSGDWTPYIGSNPQTIGLTAVFSIADATTDTSTRDTGAYALTTTGSSVLTGYQGVGATLGSVALQNATFWFGPDKADATKGFPAGATITNVKVNGSACASTVTSNYITISWANVQAAGQGSATSWTITATVNGKDYTVTYPTN